MRLVKSAVRAGLGTASLALACAWVVAAYMGVFEGEENRSAAVPKV